MLAAFEAEPAFKADASQEARVASRFALYALAGELGSLWGILPWPENEALNAAAECYRLWREARGGGSTEDRQILEAVGDFISRNGDKVLFPQVRRWRGATGGLHSKPGGLVD
jgi:putative DNA primase/helicase